MKVLMTVTRLNIGGTETYVISLSKTLLARGYDVGIATVGGPLVATCQRLGIPVHILPQASIQTPLAHAIALTHIVALHDYDLLHVHDTLSYRAVGPLQNIHPLPVVATVHGSYFAKPVIRSLGQHARLLVAVSPKLSQWVQSCGVPTEKIKVIPNGIDTVQFAPVTDKTAARKSLGLPLQGKIIAYAARFSSDKHVIAEKIIGAAERVCRQTPGVTFVLAGPGVYRNALSRFAGQANKRLGRQAIRVRPPITKIHLLYHAADLVIGTGRVALEAMACGRPVIATGVKGYLGPVTPARINIAITNHFGDHAAGTRLTVETLVQDIHSLLKKPELTQSLSKFGRPFVLQRFSIQTITSKMTEAYNDCLNQRVRSQRGLIPKAPSNKTPRLQAPRPKSPTLTARTKLQRLKSNLHSKPLLYSDLPSGITTKAFGR